uniref:UDP-N-acetylenolpyruvoylglucosamine reductase C-terminal domain-containing protein n=1 Tax=Nelumbo nucifera TaxID=4432 RepID=A0A822XST7_NELNU|nr:TPA_asm: hypothetical protein HUJ06_021981 [Nelumbo nucifera]
MDIFPMCRDIVGVRTTFTTLHWEHLRTSAFYIIGRYSQCKAMKVGSGYHFNRLGVQCTNEGFSGLEFANGQETADAIDTVEIVTVDGRHQILYRMMQDLVAIVAVTFRLLPSASTKESQQAYLRKRRRSQPVRERTAGSVFRNPLGMGVLAGELIEKAGLKGFIVGSAEVSKMLEFIGLVKTKVKKEFGIQLQEEMQYVGPFCEYSRIN